MKEFLFVGCSIPTDQDDEAYIYENITLSDSDIVIFCPTMHNAYVSTTLEHQGKDLYNLANSAKLQKYSTHWQTEIEHYLKSGKTLFLFLTEKRESFIYTGRTTVSMTGGNRKVKKEIGGFTNYNFLPFELPVVNAKGKKIKSVDKLTNGYFDIVPKTTFEAYLKKAENHRVLFTTNAGDKILGVTFPKMVGNVVVLPEFGSYPREFSDKEGSYSEKAMQFGKEFLKMLIHIDKNLRAEISQSPPPEWIDNEKFELKKSTELSTKILQAQSKIDDLNKKIRVLEKELNDSDLLKGLLYETGKPLEFAVTEALKILGFQAENFDNGILEIDQVIVSPEGFRYLGECEGRDTKAINITKFRQLVDSMNEDFDREEIEDKAFGLLFGNPERLTEPDERTLDFTEKCKNGARREKIGLILTYQLYEVAKYLTENKNTKFKKSCREAIYNGLGGQIIFPKIPK